MRFRVLCCLAAVFATASAQEAGRRPVSAAGPAVAGPIYMDAYVTPDPEGPTLHCQGKGVDCVVEARLLAPGRPTPAHDEALMETTAAINRVLASLAPPPGMKLCLYRSSRGPVLLWARASRGPVAEAPAAAGRALARGVGRITDKEAIADALGIQAADGRLAGGNRLAKVVWDPDTGHSFFACPDPGKDCVIHRNLAGSSQARVHDGRLRDATAQINQLLDQAAARVPRPGQRLCLVFLPDGPVLAWTYETERPGRAVSSADPDFARAARRALGIEP